MKINGYGAVIEDVVNVKVLEGFIIKLLNFYNYYYNMEVKYVFKVYFIF